MVYDPPPKALFCRVDGGRPGALYLVSGVLGVFWLYMLFSAGRRRVSGARTIDAGKILCRGGTDPLLCSTGPGLQNLAGLSVINEKRAFSRDRRSRTPSYRAFKPGSRPLLNSGLPEEAIWRPCSSLEVVYIQGRSAAGEVACLHHFSLSRRAVWGSYTYRGMYSSGFCSPSVHPGVGRTRIIPPNSDPISISPNLFWDPG